MNKSLSVNSASASDIFGLKNYRFIDLESTSFWKNGKRLDDWYYYYINVAEHLDQPNKYIFVSSHDVVKNELRDRGIEYKVIFPALELKEKWLEKLKERYNKDNSDKNKKALDFAVEFYDISINNLMNEHNKIIIKDINYNLEDYFI